MAKARRRLAFLLIICLCLGVLYHFTSRDCFRSTLLPTGRVQHVIIISIDALREQDLELLAQLPNIGSLVERGVSAPARCVYPSNTYPSHAAIATGVPPRVHGIVDNMMPQPGKHPFPDWYWWASALKVPAIWAHVKAAGFTTAAILWPVTAGASIDYLVPEIRANDRGESLLLLAMKYGTPILVLRLVLSYGLQVALGRKPSLDDFATYGAATIFRRYRPHLLMLHLNETDFARHRYGPEAPEVVVSLHQQDRRVGEIMKAATAAGIAEKTLFVITGDHGTLSTRYVLNLNAAFKQAGLLTTDAEGHIESWRAYALHSGGTSEVYLSDPKDGDLKKQVSALLAEIASNPNNGVIEVKTGEEAAKQYGASPEPSFYVILSPGWAAGKSLDAPMLETVKGTMGSHGYLPGTPGYRTAFIMCGPGVRPGLRLGEIRLTDEAPTIAYLLGIPMSGVEGRVLEEALVDDISDRSSLSPSR
ncbi:MAG TPA: alkaline phosphatase family protein [Firmicutes bacterium]|nr:alkaline phosphatase family protein [Bacillota bacterium]